MNDIADAYDAAASSWRRGPARIYQHLAAALLERSPVGLEAARVLDVGGGTGTGARAAVGRGAAFTVVADLAPGMLREAPGPAVACDGLALPFADASFDLAIEGFVLSHVPDPVLALSEARRVAGAIVASAFAPDWDHPAKQVVDDVMAQFGFVVPSWYSTTQGGPWATSTDELVAMARTGGWDDVAVERVVVDVHVESPAAMVEWRCGMAHLAPWLARQPTGLRVRARARAEDAVAGLPRVLVPMLALSAR